MNKLKRLMEVTMIGILASMLLFAIGVFAVIIHDIYVHAPDIREVNKKCREICPDASKVLGDYESRSCLCEMIVKLQ